MDQAIAIAKRYTELMTEAGLGELCPRIRPESNHSFHVYNIRSEKRGALIQHLKLSESQLLSITRMRCDDALL